MTPVLVGLFVVANFLAVVVALAAWERGLSPWRWFLLGLLLQIGAVFLLARAVRRAEAEKAVPPGPKLRVVPGGAVAAVPGKGTPPRLRLVRDDP